MSSTMSATQTLEANITGSVDLVQSSVSFSIASQFVENLTLTGSAAINGDGQQPQQHPARQYRGTTR